MQQIAPSHQLFLGQTLGFADLSDFGSDNIHLSTFAPLVELDSVKESCKHCSDAGALEFDLPIFHYCCPTNLEDMNSAFAAVTVASMDAGAEPTGTYSRRVTAVNAGFMLPPTPRPGFLTTGVV
jgi:hypothetical protein